MKKVAIITLCSNNNFGNKLQNYALKKELEKEGFSVSTIWVENPFKANKIKQFLKMIRNKLNDYIINYKRNINFIKFNKKYLNIAKKKIIYNDDFRKISTYYDFFIVGSDQVWNYNLVGNFDTYFMKDADKNKCISYAASIALDEIPSNLIEKYKDGFNHIKYISLRETAGKELVEEITLRKDVEVVVDPTMLLDKDEWEKIAKKPKKLKNNKYILNYFLGNLSADRKKEIERVAKDNNCEIIDILDKKSDFYNLGPEEFLYLEKNAFLICTDSFHSSVFAFLFDRPFIIFERDEEGLIGMYSRIDTLINNFQLKNRKFNKRINKENLEHDYKESYKILEKERIKARTFLMNATSSNK